MLISLGLGKQEDHRYIVVVDDVSIWYKSPIHWMGTFAIPDSGGQVSTLV